MKVSGFGKGRSAYVLYEFVVNTKLIGSRICAPGCEESDPNVYVRCYTVGKEIRVHYDPTDPQNCLLELPSDRAIKGWSLMTAIGLVFPLLYLVWLEYIKSWIIY